MRTIERKSKVALQEAYFLRFDGKKYFFEGIPFDTRRLGYIIKSGTREEIEKYIKDEHFEVNIRCINTR